jgi:hypothetical protein
MTSSSEQDTLQSNPQPPNNKGVHDEKNHPPILRSLSHTITSTDVTYPEGGRAAWSVVFSAFCGICASIGIYNSSGILEAYMSAELLPLESKSSVGWIFGIYAFVTWFLGVQIGPTFDAMGPTALMAAGTVCTLGGMFALSACTGKSVSRTRFHPKQHLSFLVIIRE